MKTQEFQTPPQVKTHQKSLAQRILTILLALSLLVSLAACSASPSAAAAPETTSAGESAVAVSDPTATGVTALSTPADLNGEISEIIGNEITLRLYANDEQITEESRTPGSGRGITGSTVPKEFSGETKTLVIPVGTPIVKRVRPTEPSTTTGETGTGPVEEAISLSDLTVGTQVKIYFKEGTEQIEKVLAIPPRA